MAVLAAAGVTALMAMSYLAHSLPTALTGAMTPASVAVCGGAADYPSGPLAEDAFHHPPNLYSASKSLCETVARQMAGSDGLDIIGLGLSVVYGVGRRRGYMTYPSALMRDAALSDSIVVRFGDQKLHWQYVEEVAGQIYNAFGDCRSWRDAASILKSLKPGLKVELRNEVDEAIAGTVEDYQTSGFVRDYGVDRRWSLEAGIADTFKTIRRWPPSLDRRSSKRRI